MNPRIAEALPIAAAGSNTIHSVGDSAVAISPGSKDEVRAADETRAARSTDAGSGTV
jgi:hypothetical protein